MIEQITQTILKMKPTWRHNGGRNPSEIHDKNDTKNIMKNDAKMKRLKKAMGPESPRAGSAGKR